jgi:hypothetical protein
MYELSDDEPTTDRPVTTGPGPAGPPPVGPPPGGPSPGSPGALRDGCRCSVLLNQAVGQGPDDDHSGFVNPLCPVHGSLGSDRDAEPERDAEPGRDAESERDPRPDRGPQAGPDLPVRS